MGWIYMRRIGGLDETETSLSLYRFTLWGGVGSELGAAGNLPAVKWIRRPISRIVMTRTSGTWYDSNQNAHVIKSSGFGEEEVKRSSRPEGIECHTGGKQNVRVKQGLDQVEACREEHPKANEKKGITRYHTESNKIT